MVKDVITPPVHVSTSIESITTYDIDIRDRKLYDQTISSDEFRTIILSIDPEISILEMERYVNWIFKSKEDLIKTSDISVGRAIRKLQTLNCFLH